MKLKTNRIEALTDGIFAIVMTVMVVSLSELFGLTKQMNEAAFSKLFLGLWQDFASYAISFLILGIVWFIHHWQFHHITHVDPALVFINIIWFMFICLIPFSTMMLGDHPSFFIPAITFEFNILVTFLVLYFHWSYATQKNRLVEAAVSAKTISRHKAVMLFFIFVILAAIAISVGYHAMCK